MVESDSRLLVAVTPSKNLESMDGSFHIDLITDVNLTKESLEKMQFKALKK